MSSEAPSRDRPTRRPIEIFKGKPKKRRRMTAKNSLGRRGHSASRKKLPSHAAKLPPHSLLRPTTLHGANLESYPIVPRTPDNTCLVSGQHVPTLEIEIWEKKFSRGMTATLGPARLLPHRNSLTRGRSSAACQGVSYPLEKKFSLLTSKRPGNSCLVSGQHVPTLEIGI